MKIVLIGTYNPSEILTGPEKFAKRIFHEMERKSVDVTFVTYYQDGRRYSLWKKLFGKETVPNNGNGRIFRMGILPL
ncbi:MAG: hypothetical protein K8R21_04745, partial [Leptospira sp.]|nr:hypothetical protein [Leptospira sp.]